MTTTKSSFSPRAQGFFFPALRRQLPSAIIVFIILFIAMVVPWLVEIPSHYYAGSYEADIPVYYMRMFAEGVYLDGGISYFIAVFLGMTAFAFAISSARYLHSMKMTDLYHSLPIRRERLMLVNTAVSMLVILGPFLLIYLGVILWQTLAYGRFGWLGSWYWSLALMDFLTIAVAVFVIYMLTTLIAVCVGTTFDAIAISGTAGFAPPLISLIASWIWGTTTYGAVISHEHLMRISPFLFFFERDGFSNYHNGADYTSYDYGPLAAYFAVWLFVGIAMGALAVYCYKRRKSELAEQTQPHGALQTAMKCLAAYCGSAFFLVIFENHPMPIKIIVIFLASVVIGLIAELVFSRGIRAVGKNIRVLGISGVVLSVFFIGLYFDPFGVIYRIPAADAIESVTISYQGRFSDESRPYYITDEWESRAEPTLTDPGSIEIVRGVHEAIIADYKANRNDSSDYYMNFSYLSIDYTLKNGSTVRRRYGDVTRETWAGLSALETQPDFISKNHPIFQMESFRDKNILKIDAVLESATGLQSKKLALTEDEAETLLDAVKSDMLALSSDAIFNGEPVLGYLGLTFWASPEGDVSSDQHLIGTNIALTGSYSKTLALIEGYGESGLLTPNPEGIAEIRVTDCVQMLYSDRRVVMGASGNYTYLFDDGYEDDSYRLFRITDPEEIASLIQKGRSSLMLTEENATSFLLMQVVGKDGEMPANQYIRIEDIPENMRPEVSAYLEGQYESFKSEQYDYYGSPMPAPAKEYVVTGSADNRTAIVVG